MPNMNDRDALIEWLVNDRLALMSIKELRSVEGFIELWRPAKARAVDRKRVRIPGSRRPALAACA